MKAGIESLYTESQDNLNSFLIGSRILGLHSVTNWNKDYIFTNCKDYKLVDRGIGGTVVTEKKWYVALAHRMSKMCQMILRC